MQISETEGQQEQWEGRQGDECLPWMLWYIKNKVSTGRRRHLLFSRIKYHKSEYLIGINVFLLNWIFRFDY